MSERPLAKFIELVQFDQQSESLRAQSRVVSQEINQQQQQEKTYHAQIAASKLAMQQARKAVDEYELKAKELDAELSEKKRRLEQIHNNKEYQSVTAEIKNLHYAQQNLETELMQKWEKLEGATRVHQERKKQIEHELEGLAVQIQACQEKMGALNEKIESRQNERTTLLAAVPEQWREPYEMMQLRVKDPVVLADRQSCTACSYMMTENDFQSLRAGKLLQCRGCYRFLYLKRADE